MNNNSISASDLKNHASEILNDVYFGRKIAVIERYGRPIAKIIPIEKSNESIAEVIDRYFGALPDFPDVTKFRRSRKRKIPALF